MSFVIPCENGCLIQIRLSPKSSKDSIGEELGGRLKISVTSPPIDGRANQHLIKVLAKKLKIAKSRLEIVSGETSRDKTVFIRDLTPEQIIAKLKV